jgi:hypothetical protein
MAETIVYPDATLAAVTAIRDGLTAQSSTATVGTRVPNPRPDLFVTVRRIGGVRRNLVVDSAQLSVECWGLSEQTAHDLAQLCRGFIHAARGTNQDGTVVYHVAEIGGPALLPDPASEQPRYVATYEIGTRGTAV